MAKKTKKTKKDPAEVTHPISGRAIAADNMLAGVVGDLETKMGKAGMIVGGGELTHVLPMPSFALRYLTMNEGLPLSRFYEVVGPQASYKSTFAVEMLRWHRVCGGGGIRCEVETKGNEELFQSVLGWDKGAMHDEDCNSLEDWMRKLTWMTTGVQKRCEAVDGPGRVIPYCFIVDTLTGKASEKTVEKIRTDGAASLGFPIEANKINTYLKAYPQIISGWPFTLVGVNHLKVHKDAHTGAVDMQVPGGWALKFAASMIFSMERFGAIKEYSTYKVANVSMGLLKNSYGPDNTSISVRFKTWTSEDAPGVYRLHSRFEWWEASIMLLATGLGMRKAQAETLLPRIKEVCDFHEESGGSVGKLWWSKRLGVASSDAMSAHELGVRLEKAPDVLSDLYNVLGIARRPFFRAGVDYMQQLEDFSHVAAQADAADDMVRRARAIQLGAMDRIAAAVVDSGKEAEDAPAIGDIPTGWPTE